MHERCELHESSVEVHEFGGVQRTTQSTYEGAWITPALQLGASLPIVLRALLKARAEVMLASAALSQASGLQTVSHEATPLAPTRPRDDSRRGGRAGQSEQHAERPCGQLREKGVAKGGRAGGWLATAVVAAAAARPAVGPAPGRGGEPAGARRA